MTTQSSEQLVLRDSDGTFYLLDRATIEAGRIPEDRQAELQKGLQGDVAGYFFNNAAFQNVFANLPVTTVNQTNTASANNVLVGAFVQASPQTIAQIQGNQANLGGGGPAGLRV